MIYKVIKTLTNSGINDITIVLGGESVGDFIRLLGDGSEFDAKFNYVYQQKGGGIAEALYLTKNIVKGNKIAVILGDNIFEDAFNSEVENFNSSDEFGCYLFLKKVNDPKRFGVAELNDNRTIKSIEEKPDIPKSNNAVTGLYFYDEKIFEIIELVIDKIGYSSRGELEITDVNNYYVNNSKAKAIFIEGFWCDAGKFETLLKSSIFVESLHKNSE